MSSKKIFFLILIFSVSPFLFLGSFAQASTVRGQLSGGSGNASSVSLPTVEAINAGSARMAAQSQEINLITLILTITLVLVAGAAVTYLLLKNP